MVRPKHARLFDALCFEVPTCEKKLEHADETFFGFIALFDAADEMRISSSFGERWMARGTQRMVG